jgi:cytochrome c556
MSLTRSCPSRCDAFEGIVAFYTTDVDPYPNHKRKAYVGRRMQMMLAMAAMVIHGDPYDRGPALSYDS